MSSRTSVRLSHKHTVRAEHVDKGKGAQCGPPCDNLWLLAFARRKSNLSPAISQTSADLNGLSDVRLHSVDVIEFLLAHE